MSEKELFMNRLFEYKNEQTGEKIKYFPKYNRSILEDCRGIYESCFILFQPFFGISEEKYVMNFKTEIKDRFPPIRDFTFPSDYDDELLKYRYSYNDNYPKDDEILLASNSLEWQEIAKLSKVFKDPRDIQQAIVTSIGAYRPAFQKPHLAKELHLMSWKHNFWFPKENCISPLLRSKFYNVLRHLGIDKVSQFYGSPTPELNLNKMNAHEFSEKLVSPHFYTQDKEIVLGTAREKFYSIIYTKKAETMSSILDNFDLEGILCTEDTQLPWDLSQDEYATLIGKERKF